VREFLQSLDCAETKLIISEISGSHSGACDDDALLNVSPCGSGRQRDKVVTSIMGDVT
jgi:hypothetical protein